MSIEREAFNRDGFLVVKNILPRKAAFDVLRSIRHSFLVAAAARRGVYEYGPFNPNLTRRMKAQGHEELFHETLKSMCELFGEDLELYKKVAAALWRKAEVYSLLHNPRIFEFLKNKLGFGDIFVPGGQVVHIMANEIRIPGGYFGFETHQDFLSTQGSLDGVVVWIPLCDVTSTNFPLEVLPGSHKLGFLGARYEEEKRTQGERDEFTPVEVRVGDVILLSVFTLHRSSLVGQSPRLAASSRFCNGLEPTFVERGFPSAYRRDVHRDLLVPDFPALEQVKKVFSF